MTRNSNKLDPWRDRILRLPKIYVDFLKDLNSNHKIFEYSFEWMKAVYKN